jgi:NADH-quinone oxidoreductase subunit H
MTVGSGVFVLLFFGGWNPLPWIPIDTFFGWIGLVQAAGHFSYAIAIIQGVLSIAIFLAKVLFMIFFFMWVRWTVPRFRYDQVMRIGWRRLLPLAIANVIVYALIVAAIQK